MTSALNWRSALAAVAPDAVVRLKIMASADPAEALRFDLHFRLNVLAALHPDGPLWQRFTEQTLHLWMALPSSARMKSGKTAHPYSFGARARVRLILAVAVAKGVAEQPYVEQIQEIVDAVFPAVTEDDVLVAATVARLGGWPGRTP